jgi:lysozyme family protein
MGIYQTAHPEWSGWSKILSIIDSSPTLEDASLKAYGDVALRELVLDFYRAEFWDRYKLNSLTNTAAEEIFIFGVNVGMNTAIKKAQELVNCTVDGIMGPSTISAINAYPEDQFDIKFDDKEKEYYEELIARKPSLKIFEKGWLKRAEAV